VLVAAARSTVQLMLIGLVLEALFAQTSLPLIGLLALVMLLVAGWEVMARQKRRYAGWWGMGIGTLSRRVRSWPAAGAPCCASRRARSWPG